MMQTSSSIVLRHLKPLPRVNLVCIAKYSRRSGSDNKYQDVFKIVGKHRNSISDYGNPASLNPNWELLTPIGYKFFLQGNTGLALNETTNLDRTHFDLESCKFECKAQECPVLLKQSIIELFPGCDLNNTKLTVISLKQRIPVNSPVADKITKTFVLAAKEISRKLKFAGYWADFINPFTGLPYLNPLYYNGVPVVAKSESRVHFQGVNITEKKNCRIIKKKSPRNFMGNVYTDAPASVEVLRQIILQDNIVSPDAEFQDNEMDFDDDFLNN
uniref:Methylmalonic aciduria and homocystinuria type D homolog, mitochondrial n=1 Tax=Cacopsylla melanoneura TaxID=428564 RepID=A0A8D8XQU8_9HEMI